MLLLTEFHTDPGRETTLFPRALQLRIAASAVAAPAMRRAEFTNALLSAGCVLPTYRVHQLFDAYADHESGCIDGDMLERIAEDLSQSPGEHGSASSRRWPLNTVAAVASDVIGTLSEEDDAFDASEGGDEDWQQQQPGRQPGAVTAAGQANTPPTVAPPAPKQATRAPEADAEVMPEVGSVPFGRWHSPWVDGRRPIGADEAPIAGSAFGSLRE